MDYKEIIGRVPVRIDGAEEDDIQFFFEDGSKCRFYHAQQCCEEVYVDDVNGDWDDLIGTPLLVAEARTEGDINGYDSVTWTFYTFRSVKGSVDVTWRGESNGYYSEEVDFEFELSSHDE